MRVMAGYSYTGGPLQEEKAKSCTVITTDKWGLGICGWWSGMGFSASLSGNNVSLNGTFQGQLAGGQRMKEKRERDTSHQSEADPPRLGGILHEGIFASLALPALLCISGCLPAGLPTDYFSAPITPNSTSFHLRLSSRPAEAISLQLPQARCFQRTSGCIRSVTGIAQ